MREAIMKPVVFQKENGEIGEVWPSPDAIEKGIEPAIPENCTALTVKVTELPRSHAWAKSAWRFNGGAVVVDLPAAKAIAHDKRRARRTALFSPLDTEATIPARAAQAEAARQAVRDNDAAIQAAINSAQTADALKTILKNYGAIS